MNTKSGIFLILAACTSLGAFATQQPLGFSLAKGLNFPVLGVGYSSMDWGALVEIKDGIGSAEDVDSLLSNRPASLESLKLKIDVDSERCAQLKAASQRGQSFERAAVHFSDGSRAHRFSIRDARLDVVRCRAGSGRVEVEGSRITYDGNVPK